MFLTFENVAYILSAFGISIWIHNWIIKLEEEYLQSFFLDEFERYKRSVRRWLFF
jgi:protein-S-isoprenylcysteine O-methyltransferase Ste14